MAHGGERALDRFRRAQVLPRLGGKVVEGEQGLAILGQALGSLLVFQFVGFDEGIERGLRLARPVTIADLRDRQDKFVYKLASFCS